MFVEIALMQRLSMFLGHPAYGIGVALFCLLLAGGAGSYVAGSWRWLAALRGSRVLVFLAMLVALEALALHGILALSQSASTPVRMAISLLLLAPVGVLMGMAFPLGAKAAAGVLQILPWLWGINGAASVLASVAAAVVSLDLGSSANLWLGACCYLFAGLMLHQRAESPVLVSR
jgi:hypothetical protein